MRKTLIGNLLSMSKSLNYQVPDTIKCDVKAKIRKSRLKDINVMTFIGGFSANFIIPDYLGTLGIDAVPISDKTKRIGSVLAILGTILVTIAFYSFQVESLLFFGAPLILVAIGIMAYGQLKKMKLKID